LSVYDIKLFAPLTQVEKLPDYAEFIKGLIDWKQSKDSEDIERGYDQKIKGLKLDGKWDWSDLIKLRRYQDDWELSKLDLPPHPLFGKRYSRVRADKLLRRGETMLGPRTFELWLDRLMLSFASVAYSDRWPEVKALGKSKKDDLYIFHYFPVNHDKGHMRISSAGFKLGRSTDPQKRLKSVKTGAACLVVPLVVIKGAGYLEPLIHAGMKSVGLRDSDEFYRPQDLMLILTLIGVAIEISETRPASYVIENRKILKYVPLPKDHEAFDAGENYYDCYCLQCSFVYNEREYGYRQVGILHEDNPFNILYPHSGTPSNFDSSWGDMNLPYYREEFKFFATMPLISLNLNLCAIKEVKKEIRRKYGSLLCEYHYEHFTLSHMDIFRSIPDCLLNSELDGVDMNAVYDMFYSRYSKD
jgi:hypothetical protein